MLKKLLTQTFSSFWGQWLILSCIFDSAEELWIQSSEEQFDKITIFSTQRTSFLMSSLNTNCTFVTKTRMATTCHRVATVYLNRIPTNNAHRTVWKNAQNPTGFRKKNIVCWKYEKTLKTPTNVFELIYQLFIILIFSPNRLSTHHLRQLLFAVITNFSETGESKSQPDNLTGQPWSHRWTSKNNIFKSLTLSAYI